MKSRTAGLVSVVVVFGSFGTAAAVAQDVENGAEVFKKCRACHQIGDAAKNAVGPVLNGLFGRKSGTIEGFTYSDANKNAAVTWTEAEFAKYIAAPRAAMPGNKMAFPGLKEPEDIKDLTAFLKQYDATGKKQ